MPLSHAQIWKAIDALAAKTGYSASGLARAAGLDPTSFNPSKRSGGDPPRPRWPSTESLTRVLSATGVSLAAFAELAQDAPEDRRAVPLLGLAKAGLDGFFDDQGYPAGDDWDSTPLPAASPSVFSLRITGDSMAPLYREGDRVIVDRDDTSAIRKGDRVVARTRSGQVLAKEVGALSAMRITLISINPAYAPIALNRVEIDWMARIQWVSQ